MNGQEFLIKTRELADAMFETAAQHAESAKEAFISTRPLAIAVDPGNIDLAGESYQLDLALFRAAPAATVPRHAEFFPLQDNGHRFLLATDGLYIEVRRPWLHFIHRLVEQSAIAMPYGKVEPRTELAFGRIGSVLGQLQEFAGSARLNLPNEHADLLVWNSQTKALTDRNAAVLESTPQSLRYECRPLDEHESVAIDLHSHGALPAFFSETDNRDDAGSVKIAGVIGNLDTPTPTAAFRLCVLGLYLPIPVPADRIFGE